MKIINDKKLRIFNISCEEEFNKVAIDIFHYQYNNNEICRNYVNLIGFQNLSHLNLSHYTQIPFLPIELYKTHKIITGNYQPEIIFRSSGTTGKQRSKHFVKDLQIYEESFTKCFEYFYGSIEEYCFIGLLPSYIDKQDSSLAYMVKSLIEKSKYKESGFYLNKSEKLVELLKKLSIERTKTLVFGVSYALLNIAEQILNQSSGIRSPICDTGYPFIVMDTGGMKGKRKEILREELHNILCKDFGVKVIHSEYGMTELFSQAYSQANGLFRCPAWMKVLIRDINDPFSLIENGKTGAINIIDLANIHSCSFIATQDMGKLYKDESFEIVGRIDNSDVRGCNLLID